MLLTLREYQRVGRVILLWLSYDIMNWAHRWSVRNFFYLKNKIQIVHRVKSKFWQLCFENEIIFQCSVDLSSYDDWQKLNEISPALFIYLICILSLLELWFWGNPFYSLLVKAFICRFQYSVWILFFFEKVIIIIINPF